VNVLVTAGPTCEDLDEVRYLTNRSSGRTGYALAAEAVRRGHATTLVSGPVALAPPEGLAELVAVRSARGMLEAVRGRFDSCDCLLMAAAVADYRPKKKAAGKMEKAPGGLVLELERTEDVLAALAPAKGRRVVVGFALEAAGVSGAGRERAGAKLRDKGLDAIVLDGPAAFGAGEVEAEILTSGGALEALGTVPKEELARRVLELAERLAAGNP